MTSNKKRSIFALNSLLIITILIALGCASIQQPLGGPRDRTPPKLLRATPANATRNFNAKVIQLDFDEYFKLTSPYQEINISPDMGKQPEYNIKQRSLVIKLKDTLAKNTTYVINFGKAIADVNESNVLKNFTYVFSTGPQIDSLGVSGTVTDPLSQSKQKDITVMLIPASKDTAYYRKKKPAIYTTTDSAGNFKMSNLHGGDYKIYALKETNNNKIYDSDDELIGFTKNTIHLTKDTGNIMLQLFKQVPEKLRPNDRKIEQDGKLFFTFNRPLTDPGVKIQNTDLDAQKIVEFSKNADTAIIYLKTMTFDSVKISFTENGRPVDTLTLRRSQKDTYKRRIALDANTSNDKLKPGTDLIFKANYPIAAIDQGRITMTEDSVEVSETDIKLIRDDADAKKFTIKYRWKQGKLYSLAFNEGTFTDIYGTKNARIVKKFDLDKPENYSMLKLAVTVPDTGQYVVQLLNANDMVVRSDVVTKNTTLIYNNFYTAKYHVKVIYDTNHNGKWDTGNVKLKIQPENIWLYKKELTVRANWDVNEPLDIPKETKYP